MKHQTDMAPDRTATTTGTRRQHGFTLIEVMITVAIVAILASIAVPSYRESIAKGRRSQATAQLLAAHQWMERFYTENFRYDQASGGVATTDAAQFPSRFSTSPPAGEGAAAYTVTLNPVNRESYTITATRAESMRNDRCGDFTITQLGAKSIVAGTFDSARFATAAAAVSACWRQ